MTHGRILDLGNLTVLSLPEPSFQQSSSISLKRQLRPNDPTYIPCRVNSTRFAGGGVRTIFEAEFEDGEIWLCRAGDVDWQCYSREFVRRAMESTISTMGYLSSHTSIPVPKVYAYESDIDQSSIRVVYMLIKPIDSGSNDVGDDPNNEKAINSAVASIFNKPRQITFSRIGWLYETADGIQIGPFVDLNGTPHGPFDSASTDYFQWRAESTLTQLRKQRLADAPEAEILKTKFICWLLPEVAGHLGVDDNGPFPLMHPEMYGCQMLLNDTLDTVNAVIDWDETGRSRCKNSACILHL